MKHWGYVGNKYFKNSYYTYYSIQRYIVLLHRKGKIMVVYLGKVGFLVMLIGLLSISKVEAQRKPTAQIGEPANTKVQTKDETQFELAKEYLLRDDYEKAASILEKLVKNNDFLPRVHAEYMNCLQHLNQDKELEKYLKKTVKRNQEISTYRIDLALFYKNHNREKEANEELEKLIALFKNNSIQVVSIGDKFLKSNAPDWAEKMYLDARAVSKDPTAYSFQLSEVYKLQGNVDKLIAELLETVEREYNNLFMVQAILQSNLQKEEEQNALQRVLLKKANSFPDKQIYVELLLWLYLQKHDFEGAFIQARSLDKRNNFPGSKSMEVASLAMQNKDYAAAAPIYFYVAESNPAPFVYAQAQRNYIVCKEELAKQEYPVNKATFQGLIQSYKSLNAKLSNRFQIAENQRSMATIYSQYLEELDTASVLLQNIISTRSGDQNLIDKCKIDLADIFVIQGIFWEATLLYSQVEKTQKETQLGHEAKLRNARLNYYRGEFVLAKEHLDVLKLATTREISNDAMDLGLLIQDKTAFDSTGKALKVYSQAELLLVQHKEAQAMKKLDSLAGTKPGAEMEEEIIYLKSKIYIATRRWDDAIAAYNQILTLYPTGLYADDALYQTALITEQQKKDLTTAMTIYSNLLKQYPGSIFVAEARKRFRALRGDKLN